MPKTGGEKLNLMYGRWSYGRSIYAGQTSQGSSGSGSTTSGSSTPLIDGVFAIKCYGKDGLKVAEYASTAKNNSVKNFKFSLVDTGCGQFEIVFLDFPDADHFDYDRRIDIHLYNDSRPWYSGRVRSRPVVGSTDTTFKISGDGHYSLLDRVLVFGTFENVDVSDIVRAIGTQVESKVGIRAISSEIERTGFTVSSIIFDGVTAKEALEQLVEFTATFVCGVDEYNRLYFKRIRSEINEQARFWAGEHLKEYSPAEDVEDLINYAWIRGGKLDDDGANWLAVVEDIESQQKYGRREAVWSLPSAFSEADAVRWGNEVLGVEKDPKQSASVKGVRLEYPAADGSFSVRKLSTQGRAAITPREGVPKYYPITGIEYAIDSTNGIQCNLKLGETRKDVSSWILGMEREAKKQEQISSNNTRQLKGGTF